MDFNDTCVQFSVIDGVMDNSDADIYLAAAAPSMAAMHLPGHRLPGVDGTPHRGK